jgi:hypothetical protein
MNAVEETRFPLLGSESQFLSCPFFIPTELSGLPVIFLVKVTNYEVSECESVSRDSALC